MHPPPCATPTCAVAGCAGSPCRRAQPAVVWAIQGPAAAVEAQPQRYFLGRHPLLAYEVVERPPQALGALQAAGGGGGAGGLIHLKSPQWKPELTGDCAPCAWRSHACQDRSCWEIFVSPGWRQSLASQSPKALGPSRLTPPTQPALQPLNCEIHTHMPTHPHTHTHSPTNTHTLPPTRNP